MADHSDRTGLAPSKTARVFEGWIARTHTPDHPLVYASGDEYRDESELTNILDQARRLSIPVTLLHPPGMIPHGSEVPNYVGKVFDAYLDGDHVVARFVIERQAGLDAIDEGIVELSLGYTANLDDKSYQRNIVLNHLSIVPAGRCGTCELNPNRVDCELAYRREPAGQARLASIVPDAKVAGPMKANLQAELSLVLDEESMRTLERLEKVGATVGAAEPKADEATDRACACKNHAMPHNAPESNMDELKKQLDEALAALKASEEKAAALATENASLKSDAAKAKTDAEVAAERTSALVEVEKNRADRLDEALKAKDAEVAAAKAARTDADAAELDARVDARVGLLTDAGKVGIENPRSMKDVEIKIAVVKKVRGKDITAKADDASYVNAMYEVAMEAFEAHAASEAAVRTAVESHKDAAAQPHTDPMKAEAEIRESAEAARRDRWKH